MRRFLATARFASVLAVVAALLATGVVAGAAGSALILGAANSAGSSSTSVTSSNAGQTLFVQNTSAGWAIRGASNAGIGGIFVSTSSTGMAGFTSTADKNAIVGTQNAGTFDDGAAVYADGRNNYGVKAFSNHTEASAVSGLHSGTLDSGEGFANGVYGESRFELGNGVFGVGSAAGETDEGWGVWGHTDSPLGFGIVGSNFGGAAALFSGDVLVEGDVYANNCFCTLVEPAIASGAIAQGQPVAIAGAGTAPDGRTVMLVRAAQAGDQVVGVADRTLTYTPSAKREGHFIVRAGNAGASDGASVLVVTKGVYAIGGTATDAGTPLALGARGLEAAQPITVDGTTFYAPGTTVGYSLGSVDGTAAIFVDPH